MENIGKFISICDRLGLREDIESNPNLVNDLVEEVKRRKKMLRSNYKDGSFKIPNVKHAPGFNHTPSELPDNLSSK